VAERATTPARAAAIDRKRVLMVTPIFLSSDWAGVSGIREKIRQLLLFFEVLPELFAITGAQQRSR
jgi:hypothetical protein